MQSAGRPLASAAGECRVHVTLMDHTVAVEALKLAKGDVDKACEHIRIVEPWSKTVHTSRGSVGRSVQVDRSAVHRSYTHSRPFEAPNELQVRPEGLR